MVKMDVCADAAIADGVFPLCETLPLLSEALPLLANGDVVVPHGPIVIKRLLGERTKTL